MFSNTPDCSSEDMLSFSFFDNDANVMKSLNEDPVKFKLNQLKTNDIDTMVL